MYGLISLFWIISVSGFLTLSFRKRFEVVLPLTFVLTALLFYLFAFFRMILTAYYLTWGIAIIFWVTLIYLFLKKKEVFKVFLDNYLTIGLFLFGVLYILITVIFKAAGLNYWDEFQHWGPMVRETLRYNTFYSIPESALVHHKDYPPFFALLHTLFCCFREIWYQENRVFISQMTFMASLFFPVLSKLDRKKITHWIMGLVMVISFILIGLSVTLTPNASDLAHVYNSIYVDWPMAVFTAYTLLTVIRKEDNAFYYFSIFCDLTALLLMKQMGLPFGLLTILLLVLILWGKRKELLKREYVYVLLACVLPFAVYLSWHLYIKNIGVLEDAQFSLSQIDLSLFTGIMNKTSGEVWQQEAFANYIQAVVSRPLLMKPVRMSYFPSCILIAFLILSSGLFKREGRSLSFTYLFGSVGYAVAMLLLYVYSFGESEGPILASFDRYMLTYIYIGLCLFLMYLFYRWSDKKEAPVFCLIGLLGSCLFADFSNLKDLKIRQKEDNAYSDPGWFQFSSNFEKIEDKRVLIVEQYARDTLTEIMLYYGSYYDYGVRLVRLGDRGWNTPLTIEPTLEEWKDLLKEYAYIYIVNYDDYFIENYWSPLTGEAAYECGMYEILIEGNDISFRCINEDVIR